MSRSNAAKNWQPSASDQKLIDILTEYHILAEQCLIEIRKFDYSYVQTLWPDLQAAFQADNVNYPSILPLPSDIKGTKDFFAKCQAICFPPPSTAPRGVKDYILMYFSAVTCLQGHTSQQLHVHPFALEMSYRANLAVMKVFGGEDLVEAAVNFENGIRDKPLNLLGKKVRRHDRGSGRTIEYTVVDCGTSALNGDYVVLDDGQGGLLLRPERWETTPEAAASIPGVSGNMLTFFGGPRACIGYRFAIVEMKALLFTLVRGFEFELAVSPEDIGKFNAIVQHSLVLSDPAGGNQMPLLLKPVHQI